MQFSNFTGVNVGLLDIVSLNCAVCAYIIYFSIKNTYYLKCLLKSNFIYSKFGILKSYREILQFKDIMLFNWIPIKRSLSKKWNCKIDLLALALILNPIFFYNFIGSNYFSVLCVLEIALCVMIIFVVAQRSLFFKLFGDYFLPNKQKEFYSDYEVKSLISNFISAQEHFEQNAKINQEIKESLHDFVQHLVVLSKNNHASKVLLEKLTEHIMKNQIKN